MGNLQMKITKEQLTAKAKYLIPKNNIWLKRAGLIFCFILFDYLSTLIFITSPIQEGNLLVRQFMETYGIFLGLTIFDVLINIPIYMIICFNSHFSSLPSRFARIADPLIDVFLAWFVAGYHYSGATSWFWTGPDMIRQLLGFSIYFTIIMFMYQTPNMQQVFLCKQKAVKQ
jgi:hypothetical protein